MSDPSHRYLRIAAVLPPACRELFVELCWDFNTSGLSENDHPERIGFEAWFDSSSIPVNFIDRFREQAERRRIDFLELRFDEIEDQPALRIESQKKAFSGFDLDDVVHVHPGWESPSARHPCNILMEPGHAFGTGSHESTQLCLQAMVEVLPQEGRFLDVGTGSGILSIAAAKLRPRLKIFALDNDWMAVEAARSNLLRNGVTARLLAGGLEAVDGKFDFVAANLTLEIFRSAAAAVAGLADGPVLISGFTAEQGELVLDCFQSRRFGAIDRWAKNGWQCFLLRKR